jgi:hypothetical protein
MIIRVGWISALIALALVTTFAQMDRSSRFNPALAPLVPQPFRGFAQARLTEMAVQAQDGQRAQELARELVRVRPIPAENLTLLSQANLLAGDVDGGLGALELAGTRGWREPFSQRAMAQAALLVGNVEAASQRIAALMATGRLEAAEIDQLLVALTTTPEGRAALAARLAEGGHWQRNFVGRGRVMIGPEAYVDTIVRAQAIGARLDCRNLATAVEALRRNGQEGLADRIRTDTCRPD